MRYRHKHQPDVLILHAPLEIVTEWRVTWDGKRVPAKIERGEAGMALVGAFDLKGRYAYTFMQPDELRRHVEAEDDAGPDVVVHVVQQRPPLPPHAVAQTTK